MTFSVDPEVGAVLTASAESDGPPPMPPVEDIDGRRAALNPILDYFNNQAQTPPVGVEISDQRVPVADGTELCARRYRPLSGGSGAAVLYLHGGGMIVGSVPIFDGPVRADAQPSGSPRRAPPASGRAARVRRDRLRVRRRPAGASRPRTGPAQPLRQRRRIRGTNRLGPGLREELT
jgi:hypothetical protein